MEYRVIIQGVDARRKLYPVSMDFNEVIGDKVNRDWYHSVFKYTEAHKKRIDETGTPSGIRDVTTDLLAWDFDSDDLEQARQDTVKLCTRLLSHGIVQDDISICFSGRKGFSVLLKINKDYTVEEFGNINRSLAKDLKTNDTSLVDPQRIFRIKGTKHQKSGLYKYPLNLHQLSQMPLEDIKRCAADEGELEVAMIESTHTDHSVVEIPTGLDALKVSTETKKPTEAKPAFDIESLRFNEKPKGFTNCKYAIMNGFFAQGQRNNCMMAMAATCRAQHFPKEVAYNMCKAALRLQSERTGGELWNKSELWLNVINKVYDPTWGGGQYSCKSEGWLKDFCQTLGKHTCNHSSGPNGFIQVEEMGKAFEDYSFNIEQNTIKTGIDVLDENVQLTIGMPVGILGAPSSGKTTLSLDILSNTSKAGLSSVFFSMDMFGPLIFQKQIQRYTGMKSKEIHQLWKEQPKEAQRLNSLIKEEYKHVKFSTKAGHTVQDMREIISDYEQATSDKVKLVLIDYLECISGPYSDATANSAKVALELKDFAIETGTCIITLVQPPKSAGDASMPLYSMRQVKGSSMLEQSFRVILSLYREGFGPKYIGRDKFITINALKNSMGELFSSDNYWDGSYGKIRPLDEDGRIDLNTLREDRKKDVSAQGNSY